MFFFIFLFVNQNIEDGKDGEDGQLEEEGLQKEGLHQPEVHKQREKHFCHPRHDVKICR